MSSYRTRIGIRISIYMDTRGQASSTALLPQGMYFHGVSYLIFTVILLDDLSEQEGNNIINQEKKRKPETKSQRNMR